ncbi:hypothetical protein [Microbacterium sp. SA39]|uniref:hypothetical protein n=1 Tax=Microbacterium sp. SA39 TaxID=1263625 RepID=UPI0005FA79C1|nr:hypothetical protein [Microbacterium sp. SA39]KJQ54660.1 hypothetical protein RS85_01389 [Microbacterium sp. SA39]
MMSWTNIRDFAKRCQALGITVPEPVVRGLHLAGVASAHEQAPSGRLIDMTDDELRDRVTDIAIRLHDRDGIGSNRGMAPGVRKVQEDLLREVVIDTVPHLEEFITDLRPRFEEAIAPLVDAAQNHGITYATTSDFVIDQDDATIAAYRAAKRAWFAVQPIASFRIDISKTFGLEPTGGMSNDFSVLFAAGDNWGHGGRYYLEGKTQSHLDWFALTAGGVTLNGITDVHNKLRARRARPNTVTADADGDLVFVEIPAYGPMPTFPRS